MVAASIAFGWLFAEVRSTVAHVKLSTEEAQLLVIKNAHTQTVRRVVRDTQKEREELNSYFVTEEEIVGFLERIEKLQAQTGTRIDIRSVGVGAPVDKDELITPLLLTLESKGTFQDVFYTLSLLEALPTALTVKSARITQNPTSLVWEGSFDVAVIKVIEPEDI